MQQTTSINIYARDIKCRQETRQEIVAINPQMTVCWQHDHCHLRLTGTNKIVFTVLLVSSASCQNASFLITHVVKFYTNKNKIARYCKIMTGK